MSFFPYASFAKYITFVRAAFIFSFSFSFNRQAVRANAMDTLRKQAAALARQEVDTLRSRLRQKYDLLERARLRQEKEEAEGKCPDCLKIRCVSI